MITQIPFEKADSEWPKRAAPVENVVEGGFHTKTFVENFETLCGAEGGIHRLRELVQELVFSGALESSPAGRPNGITRLPSGWRRLPLEVLCEGIVDSPHRTPKYSQSGAYPALRPRDVTGGTLNLDGAAKVDQSEYLQQTARRAPREGDIVYSRELSFGWAVLLPREPSVCLSQGMVSMRPSDQIHPAYLVALLNSPIGRRQAVDAALGAAHPHVNLKDIRRFSFPVPPLAEQKRIVAKVHELMRLLDELKAKHSRKRSVQTRLRIAALNALTSAEGQQEVKTAWNRVEVSFGVLFERAESVTTLREAALDLALRGRLSSRDPTDQPARALVEDMLRERGHVGARSTRAASPPVGVEPFSIPQSWSWERLDRLWLSISDGDHQPPPKESSGIAFLTIGNLSRGILDFSQTRFVSERYFRALDEMRAPRKGDLLYTVVGSFGIPVLVDSTREFCVQRHIAILRPYRKTNVRWMYYWLRSGFVFRQAQATATGIAQPTVGLGSLRAFLVPVPPEAEQDRIVRRLDHVMKLCDDLEAKLRHSEDAAEKLVEAVVAAMTLGGAA